MGSSLDGNAGKVATPQAAVHPLRFAVADGGRTLPGDDADLYDPDTTPPTCARRMSAMAATSRTAKKVLTI
jgi:hypothetical protein